MYKTLKIFIYFFIFSIISNAGAQSILSKEISISVKDQPLGRVFDFLEQRENFKFSYYSKLVPRDSIISISTNKATIEDVLDELLSKRYEYKETAGHLILRYAPLELALLLEKNVSMGEYRLVTGYVIDINTGRGLGNVSVYEKNILQSTLTNSLGYFELHLKNSQRPIELTASKENYKSVTSMFLPEVIVQMGEKKNIFDYVTGDFSEIEKSGIGRFFISSRQKLQSLNIGGFIAKAPVQFSIIPSISSHGMMNAQIVNNFSLNIIGGYSAGVRGFEIAGLYNINKMNVEALQMAGLFNTAGGNVTGVQLAGLYNSAIGNLIGIQLGGLHNSLKGSMNGMQLAYGYNKVGGDARGVQLSEGYNNVKGTLAGIQVNTGYNRVGKNLYGVQLSAGYNYVKDSLNGLQLNAGYNRVGKYARGMQMGIVNYAKKIDGVQFGLINVSDTTSGYSIGLINIKKGGYKKLDIFNNELTDINVSIKTGDNKLYTILTAGRSDRGNKGELYSLGFGIGKNIPLGKKISFNPEIINHYIHLDNWDDVNSLVKFSSLFTMHLSKHFAVFGGPTFNVYTSIQKDTSVANDTFTFVEDNTARLNLFKDKNVLGWVGWSIGLTLL